MIASSSRTLVRSAVVLWSLGAALVIFVFYVGMVMEPSLARVALAGACLAAVAPFVATAGLRRPLAVVFAVWAALVPFDNVLRVPGILTLGKAVGAVAALLAILNILVSRRAVRPPAAVLCWTAFVGFAGLSLVWAGDPRTGAEYLTTLGPLLFVAAAVGVVAADRFDLTAVALGTAAGGVLASIVGVSDFVRAGHRVFFGDAQVRNGAVDPNHYGAALLAPALCCLVAAVAHPKWFVRAAALVAAAICAAGILATESRGALIAYAAAVLYIAIRSPYRWRLLPFFAAAAALLATFHGVLDRFGDPSAANASGRSDIWEVALAAFRMHPVFGWGFGTFQDALVQGYFQVYIPPADVHVRNAHNVLIATAVELGAVGFAAIMGAWWSQLRAVVSLPASGSWGGVRVAAEAITIALFVVALSLDLLIFKYTWLALTVVWIARAAYVTESRS